MPPQHEHKPEDEALVNYRLDRLEEAVSTLIALKEIVTRWDARFSNESFLQCPIHNERMIIFNTRMEKAENDISDLKKFVYKATGALVVISIIIQLAGPFFFNRITDYEKVVVPTHEHVTVTNVVSPDGLPMTIGH